MNKPMDNQQNVFKNYMWDSERPQGEKTEWEDILVKHGIRDSTREILTEDQKELIGEMMDEAVFRGTEEGQRQTVYEKGTLEEIDELEDDDDEAVFEQFRAQRVLQLQAQAARERYGTVRQISEPEFVSEVAKAADCWVVCLLFKDGVMDCDIINARFQFLAKKFKATKFVKIISNECIHNYPDRNLPTVLIYHDGKMKAQLVGMSQLGGKSPSVLDVEWVLKRHGAVESNLEHDPKGATTVRRGFKLDKNKSEWDSDSD
eukprot:TRINITY_DN78_c0_g1_i1.p1 TRINITY_DN78_c0_g1~~TRINITY_DN78_c0_g1_i1.p1  ORF type:complete len:260 (+),score=73.61 TRINITY_DN78_c0_g1_i1:47-826(+)